MVANHKGGVGKTTLTTYLTAYFLSRRKRVLVIDIDYQARLPGGCWRRAVSRYPEVSSIDWRLANTLLSGDPLPHGPPKYSSGQLSGTQLITADYTLTQYETQLMLRWLGQHGDPDIRFNLAQVLMSDPVQNNFDIVLIDAPAPAHHRSDKCTGPCLHLLVPTKLDALSAETVGSFLRQVAALRRQLSLGLDSRASLGP